MRGIVTFKFDKWPLRLVLAIASLSSVTLLDVWPRLNWYGQFLMIAAITLLMFMPHVSVGSNGIWRKEEN